MDYYVDMTASTVGYVNWAAVAPFEPERRERSRTLNEKDLHTPISNAPGFFDPVTGPGAPTARLSRNPRKLEHTEFVASGKDTATLNRPSVSDNAQSDLERIAKQRVRLMAAKYASKVESSEMVARLEILNQRLIDRFPRVSEGQVNALETAAGQLAQARSAREERMRRLGINV